MVQVHYNKNVELFNQKFDNIAFKASETIEKSEKYDWVLKIAISSLKWGFLFITFLNLHLMICTSQI